MGGEDAVVDDVVDCWVGAQGGEGGVFVGVGGGVENADAEGSEAAEDVHACDACLGFVIGGEDTVAVGDKKAMRDGVPEGAGKLLGVRAQSSGAEEAGEDEGGVDDDLAQLP